jgi:hypothetical protein
MNLQTYILGARLIYWLYLAMTLLFAGGVVLYVAREWLLKKFYSVKSPEKLIKCVVVYPGKWIRNFYRLIPDSGFNSLPGGAYNYTEKAVYRNRDIFAYNNQGGLKVDLDNMPYFLKLEKAYKKRFEPWPEIHYIYGNPLPVDYDMAIKKDESPAILFNSSDLERLKKSTILTQIYNAMSGANLLAVAIILLIILLILNAVGLANSAGLIHLAKNVTTATTTAAKVIKP